MKLKRLEYQEFLTPPPKMEGKWWEIRKGYGLSQSNSYGEGVGRIFYGVRITADNGCDGPVFENGEIIVPTCPGVGYSPNHWPYAVENSLRSFTLE